MEKLHLEIITPEKLLVREDADIVEAPGAAGEFGVLPGHVPFLSTLDHGEVRFSIGGSDPFCCYERRFCGSQGRQGASTPGYR